MWTGQWFPGLLEPVILGLEGGEVVASGKIFAGWSTFARPAIICPAIMSSA